MYMTKYPERTSHKTNKLKDELILEEHGQVRKVAYSIAPVEFCS